MVNHRDRGSLELGLIGSLDAAGVRLLQGVLTGKAGPGPAEQIGAGRYSVELAQQLLAEGGGFARPQHRRTVENALAWRGLEVRRRRDGRTGERIRCVQIVLADMPTSANRA
ncbi:hypothetical protein ACVIIW_006856 [Bradyrhizobium sp. USDA 4449]